MLGSSLDLQKKWLLEHHKLPSLHQQKKALYSHKHAPWWPSSTARQHSTLTCMLHGGPAQQQDSTALSQACSMVAQPNSKTALHSHKHAPWWPSPTARQHCTLTSMLHGGPAQQQESNTYMHTNLLLPCWIDFEASLLRITYSSQIIAPGY